MLFQLQWPGRTRGMGRAWGGGGGGSEGQPGVAAKSTIGRAVAEAPAADPWSRQ